MNGAVHEAVDRLSAGGKAWTDYSNHDRLLTKDKQHDQAKPVTVIDPLMPGDRVKIKQTSPWSGIYEASKE